MVTWRVYYTDGSTFDSTDGEPRDAPGLGAQVIIQRDSDSRIGSYLAFGGTYYFWKEGRWFACDREGFWQYFFHNKYDHEKVALMGESVGNEIWNKILRRAKEDKDFF